MGFLSCSMTDAALVPGQVLAGKFRVERVLGKGGMGMVVAARHVHLDERVAIKVLLPEMVNGDIVARFVREAKAAVRIRSEHVAKVSDVGSLDDGAPYMVMEYLEGQDLSQVLESRRSLTVDEVVEYVLQACAALAEAHAYGIVHRDLKPANLFLTHRVDGSPCVKVLDFGVSKLLTRTEEVALTKTGGMLGSPLYMSPEQLTNSKQVDARSDLWALGVIMYELLSGSPPFSGEELPIVIVNILQGELRPLYDCVLPDGLEAVVMRCLARDRDQRYQSVLELAEALAPFASERGLRPLAAIRAVSGVAPSVATSRPSMQAPTPAPAMRTTAPSVSAAASTTAPSRAKSGGVPLWLAPVGLGVLLAVALGVAFVVRSLGPQAAASATPSVEPPKPEPPKIVESAPTPSAEPPVASASASATTKASVTKPKPIKKGKPGVIDDPL